MSVRLADSAPTDCLQDLYLCFRGDVGVEMCPGPVHEDEYVRPNFTFFIEDVVSDTGLRQEERLQGLGERVALDVLSQVPAEGAVEESR